MRPEPSHRTQKRRKRYNEASPLTLRIGAIQAELDARSDGTMPGYRAVIMRDLKRYYEMCQHETEYVAIEWGEGEGQRLYRMWQAGELDRSFVTGDTGVWLAVVDACERVNILVTHAGLSVDEALVSVGLVKQEG